MVIVSHDRHLLKTVTDELVMVHDGKAELFDGDLDDYANYIKQSMLEQKQQNTSLNGEGIGDSSRVKELSRKEQRQQEAELRKQLQPLRNELKKLEKQLDNLNEKKQKLENELADPDSYLDENKESLKKCLLAKSDVDKSLEDIEMAWMDASEAYEVASKNCSI